MIQQSPGQKSQKDPQASAKPEATQDYIARVHSGVAFALIAFAATLIVTVVVPGAIAYSGEVFLPSEAKAKLPPIARSKLEQFDKAQQQKKALLVTVDAALADALANSKTDELDGLVQLRASLQQELAGATPPVTASAFSLNQMSAFYWPGFYICLVLMVTLLKPARVGEKPHSRSIIVSMGLGLILYTCYQLASWARALLMGEEARSVYSYMHQDINFPSFIYQELEILGMMMLIATIWRQWGDFLLSRREELRQPVHDAREELLKPSRFAQVSDTFVHWQAAAAPLAVYSMLVFSFYWRSLASYRDSRYLLSAFVLHVIVILTWCAISLPLLITWRNWNHLRIQAIRDIAQMPGHETQQRWLEMVKELKPFGTWNAIASLTVAFSAVLLPLLESIF